MRLTNEEAISLRVVRAGGVYYDDTAEQFVGLGNSSIGLLEWADRAGLLVVVWRERSWRRVPVRLSGLGETAVRAWERRIRARPRPVGKTHE